MTFARTRPRRSALAAAAVGTLLASTATALPAAAEAPDLEWEAIVFGQSTDLNFASNVLPEKVGTNDAEPDVPGTIEGEIVLESRGGKLAPGHDGLVFYHVELDPNDDNFVLEADVTLDQLGPETDAGPNGQEGAGLMVRDVNGAPRQDPMVTGYEEVPAASNMAAVLFMRDGVRSMSRTHVTEPWGNVGSHRTSELFTDDSTYEVTPGSDEPVTMRLERTDTEFIMSATFHTDGDDTTFSQSLTGADWMQEIAPDSMTVGFFASRNAKIRVNDASLALSQADTQPRPAEPEPESSVSLEVLSPEHSGSTDYPVRLRPSHDGTVEVTANGEPILEEPVVSDEKFTTTFELPTGDSELTATLTPEGGADPVTETWNAHVRIFEAADLIVATDGSPEGEGTRDAPLDVVTATQYVLPGQTVLMQQGTYELDDTLHLSERDSGEEGARKTLAADEGAQVEIDGGRQHNIVLQLNADYWHVRGLSLTEANSNGMRVAGSHNVIEEVVFHNNGDTGFQMTGSGDPSRWPAHNLVINSESHDNRDDSDINADGFAAKLGVGPGNVFRGNLSHHNIDDGWDLYNRTNEGANFPITLENNIAYSNGKLSDGYNADGNTGNGFKLGGEGLPVDHVVRGNLAFDNNMDGFTDNFNPGRLTLTNNTSIDNKRFNYLFRINPYFEPEEQGVFRANLSVHTNEGLADSISGDVDATNFLRTATKTTNGEETVSQTEFISLDAPSGYERGDDGELVWGDYTRPVTGSFLNTAGLDGGHVGALAGEEAPPEETSPPTETESPESSPDQPTDDPVDSSEDEESGEVNGPDEDPAEGSADASDSGALPDTGLSPAAPIVAAFLLTAAGAALAARRRARLN